ncbi:MAG: ABC transporter permease [Longimicrobiaceae bacterium]
MTTLLQDLRYGLRALLKSPGFAVTAVLTIALGVGATTTVFTLVNALLLRPLPVSEPGRLVQVEELRRPSTGGESFGVTSYSYPRYAELRDASGRVLAGLAAQGMGDLALRSDRQAEAVMGVYASGNYFGVLGIRPEAGRFFGADEDRPGSPAAVAVISEHLWRTRFGGERSALGQTLHLNGQPVTVVGVAPRGFGGTFVGVQADVWVPIAMYPRLNRQPDEATYGRGRHVWLTLFGRLKPGVPQELAATAMGAAARGIAPELERDAPAVGVRLEPLTGLPPDARGAVLGFMSMLLATAGLVMLIAGTNVAGMLLARATTRRREVAIRLAVGAGRGRLVRQLLTESLVLFVVGGTGGLLLAIWLSKLISAFQPPVQQRIALDLGPDLRVLGFTLLLALVAGVGFGLTPALRASHPDVLPALRETSGGRGAGRTRLRSAFVVAQLAMSLLLLVTAGLFVQALRGALATDLGFEPDGVVVADLNLRAQGFDSVRGRAFHAQAVERLSGLPGVEAVGAAQFAPMSGNLLTTTVDTRERPVAPDVAGRRESNTNYMEVDAGYFRALRIPLLAGRGFTANDREGAPPVVVVNQTLARRWWPGENPVGKRLRVFDEEHEVVGLARDGKYQELGEDAVSYVYLPMAQQDVDRLTLFVRSRTEPGSTLAAVRREMAALDPDVPLQQAMPFPAMVGMSLFPQRIAAVLVGVFGLLGLVLAAVGIYGVLAFHVGQRTQEIGVRMALGATAADVVRLVLRQGLVLVAVGVALGLAAAFAATRLLASFLHGVSATDPTTFLAVPLLLAAVALLASWLPARRASRVDPMTALRTE